MSYGFALASSSTTIDVRSQTFDDEPWAGREAADPIKVLVVEDNDAQRLTLCKILKRQGYEPFEARDGEEALDLAARLEFAVAILDLRLPDLPGNQVLARIRASNDLIQAVFHTAYGSFDSAKDAVNLGTFAYLEKPCEPQELLRIVEEASGRWLRQALYRSKVRYRLLTELSPVGIFHTNASGIYSYVNERWTLITGISRSEVMSIGWVQALHPEDRDAVQRKWYRCLAQELPFRGELRFLKKDGTVNWVYAQTSPQIDRSSKVLGYIGTLTDLTKPRLAEQSLRILDTAVEHMVLPVSVLTAGNTESERRFIYANRAFLDLVGYEEDDLYGNSPSLLYGPQTLSDALQHRSLAMAAGQPFTDELVLHRKNGTTLHTEWHLAPVLDLEQQVTHWVLTSHLTEEKANDKIA